MRSCEVCIHHPCLSPDLPAAPPDLLVDERGYLLLAAAAAPAAAVAGRDVGRVLARHKIALTWRLHV